MTVGQRIKALRDKHKFSQQYMADKLGMTRAGYGNIELGRSQPPADRLQDIADIFNVPVGSLFPRRAKKEPANV